MLACSNYDLPADKIQSKIIDFVKKNHPTVSFYIRPFVYTSDLGISPRLHNVEKNFFVYGLEPRRTNLSPEGVTCRISSWYRQEDRSLPLRGKISGAYITSSLAKTEAVESGFDEAILMNSQGGGKKKVKRSFWDECVCCAEWQLITPGYEQDILEGITRDSILTIARSMGVEVVERPVDKSETANCLIEVFLSGTAAKITPVRQVETYKLSSDRPVTTKLREKLTAITEGRDDEYREWFSRLMCESTFQFS